MQTGGMTILRLMLLPLLLLAAAPASAGTRATYAGDPGHALVVEVTDGGDVRIGEANTPNYGLLKGGVFYIVQETGGTAQVARIADVADAIDRVVVPPIFGGILARAPAPAPLGITRGTASSVGGRTGTAYRITGLDPAQPEQAADYVISTDADLKPVGAALEAFMNAALLPGAAFSGPGTAMLVRQTRAIFALGTPIDAGGRFRLDRIETLPIPAARAALPAPPASVADLVAAMHAAGRE